MAYKRKTFLINRKFQIKFSFYLCTWLLALTLVYPVALYKVFDFFLHFAALNPDGPRLSDLQSVRDEMFMLLVGFQVIVIIVSAVIGIFLSHRVAGPLYKLGMFFSKVKNGENPGKLRFRTNDYFPEVATGFNEMLDSIESRLATARSHLEKATAQSDLSACRQEIGKAVMELQGLRPR